MSFGDYLFVHAGVRPGVPLEAQDPMDLVWIRGPFLKYLAVQVVQPQLVELTRILDAVEIDVQERDTSGKVYGCCSLPYATLLVADDENRQFGGPVTRETSAEIGVKLGAGGSVSCLSF